jgi:hypothetical protein
MPRQSFRLGQIPDPPPNEEASFPDGNHNRIGQTLWQVIELRRFDGIARIPCRPNRRNDNGRATASATARNSGQEGKCRAFLYERLAGDP